MGGVCVLFFLNNNEIVRFICHMNFWGAGEAGWKLCLCSNKKMDYINYAIDF